MSSSQDDVPVYQERYQVAPPVNPAETPLPTTPTPPAPASVPVTLTPAKVKPRRKPRTRGKSSGATQEEDAPQEMHSQPQEVQLPTQPKAKAKTERKSSKKEGKAPAKVAIASAPPSKTDHPSSKTSHHRTAFPTVDDITEGLEEISFSSTVTTPRVVIPEENIHTGKGKYSAVPPPPSLGPRPARRVKQSPRQPLGPPQGLPNGPASHRGGHHPPPLSVSTAQAVAPANAPFTMHPPSASHPMRQGDHPPAAAPYVSPRPTHPTPPMPPSPAGAEKRKKAAEKAASREKKGTGERKGGREDSIKYDVYESPQACLQGVAAGTHLCGTLRINRRNRLEAYVSVENRPDTFVWGNKARNRSLEGDMVYVRLLVGQELEVAKELRQKNRRKEDLKHGREPSTPPTPLSSEIELPIALSTDTDGDVEIETEVGAEVGAEVEVSKEEDLPWGVVVRIADRDLTQAFAGTLHAQRPGGNAQGSERERKGGKGKQGGGEIDTASIPPTLWFKPMDKRTPLFSCQTSLITNTELLSRVALALSLGDGPGRLLVIARIDGWDQNSSAAHGHIVRVAGVLGELETEALALLTNNNVRHDPFTPEVEACLPPLPWVIPEEEIARRRDLRKDRVFTIDPATAKDLDDAVSYRLLPGGQEALVGVHIADVSHFVRPGTALDEEAGLRCTSTYLVDGVIPMLPALLCEELCSLNPGVERLAFSVMWRIRLEGAQVLDRWYGRTVIDSCARLAYEDAQEVIGGGPRAGEFEMHGGHGAQAVCEDILGLQHLAGQMRKARFEGGALSTGSVRLSFGLDAEGMPVTCAAYRTKDANWLIEEFMLLANQSVAERIHDAFPRRALLRRHEAPIQRRLVEFERVSAHLGYPMDASSAGALHRSLHSVEDEGVRMVLQALSIKAMHRAKYVSTGTVAEEALQHYALNMPFYTHFTSPIRRYADVIVHRLLQESLDGQGGGRGAEEEEEEEQKMVSMMAKRCNQRKDGAKGAQDQSIQAYLMVYLERQGGAKGITAEGVVMEVKDRSILLLIEEYGVEERMFLDKCPVSGWRWDGDREEHVVKWNQGDGEEKRIRVFTRVRVQLRADAKSSPGVLRVSVLGEA